MPHATSYGLDWPFTLKPRENKPAASSRRRSHTHYDISVSQSFPNRFDTG